MKNIQLSALAGLCLSASLMAPALAQEVDEIIVSATGIPTPAAQIGASVDVLTAEDLENQQVIYLQDALKLKGINIPQSGGIGTLSNVFLRGLPGKYTDLVIDGISMYDPRSEQVLWQDITTDGVEQVEILRGSQGVLFGSNTIAGVVSQFTKLGGETENRIRLEAGELSTQKLSMTGNGARGDVDYGYALSRSTTDGISAVRASSGDTDGYENTTLHAIARAHFSEDLTVDVVLRGTQGESDFDDFSNSAPYGPADALGKREVFSRSATRLTLNYQQGDILHSLALNTYDAEIDSLTNFIKSSGEDSRREQASYKGHLSSDAFDLIVGLEETDVSRQISDVGYESSNAAVSVLVTSMLADLIDVTLGVREDDHQYFGSHVTFRATAALPLQDRLIVRAAHGTGFRAPTLYNLYSVYGNQDLKPETSESSELGFDFQLSPETAFSMTAYQVDIEDLIEYQSSNSPPYGSYEQGAGTTTSKGVELDFEHALNPQAVIHFATAYTDSKVPDTDGGTKRQVRVPRLQSDLTVHFEPQAGWSLSANVHHVKGVVDGGLDLDDYTLVNLRASYQFEDNLKLYARIDNASDESYETISGYGTLGRNAHIGLTASF